MKELIVTINDDCRYDWDGITNKAEKIIEQVQKTPFQKGCFDKMCINVHYRQVASVDFPKSANLTRVFQIYTYKKNGGPCGKHCGYDKCLDALGGGKCVDKYMRATVGRVLYPQHYGNEK